MGRDTPSTQMSCPSGYSCVYVNAKGEQRSAKNVVRTENADVPGSDISVVAYLRGCHDYFLASGPKGYYLLEWYGGYTPDKGDTIAGDLDSYGLKDVAYPGQGEKGRVYVDDYWLSKSRATDKYFEKCN